MNAFLSLGRLIFPLPFLVFGLFHFMNATQMAGAVPTYFPAPIAWVYLTGASLVAAAVGMYLGKYDKLAATLLSVFMLILILTVHLPGAMSGTEMSQMSVSMLLKDLGLMGGAMLYATYVAKDRSVIG